MIAAAATAQPRPRRTGSRRQPSRAPAVWNPVAPYITAGQDEPGYRSWYLAAPWRAGAGQSVQRLSRQNQVAGILPTWTLLRTATSWQECGGQPFEVPPRERMAAHGPDPALRPRLCDPAVGPVEAVSVYRNPALNKCAGGAPESAHKLNSAIDMVPLRPIDRVTLMRKLCGDHSRAWCRLQRRPWLLCLSALPRGQHQVPPLEHGPGGRRRMPADGPSGGHRERRTAAAAAASPSAGSVAPAPSLRHASGVRHAPLNPRPPPTAGIVAQPPLPCTGPGTRPAAVSSSLVLPICNTISVLKQRGVTTDGF